MKEDAHAQNVNHHGPEKDNAGQQYASLLLLCAFQTGQGLFRTLGVHALMTLHGGLQMSTIVVNRRRHVRDAFQFVLQERLRAIERLLNGGGFGRRGVVAVAIAAIRWTPVRTLVVASPSRTFRL